VFHQQNAGPAWTRQQAVEKATGEFVVPLDADDYLHPDAVRVWLDYWQKNPRFVVVYGDYFRVDESNTIIDEYKIRERRDDPLEGNILDTMVRQNCVTATALIKRDKVLEVGGYYSEDTSHTGRGHEDYFLYLKLLIAGYEFGYVPRAFLYYRNTTNSVSNRKSGFYENRLAVLKHIYKLDTDRMVEATDYATWKRVDQLNDAFYTISVRDQEIEALRKENEALRAQLAESQARPYHPANSAVNGSGAPESLKAPDLIPSPSLPPELGDVKAQLDELARLKQSRAFRLLYKVIDPAVNGIKPRTVKN
jgi:glycosyltransferase involved in cell wall biosynthesis